MALSRIWSAFILISLAVAAFKWLVLGDVEIFSRMVTGEDKGMIDTTILAVNIAIKLVGIMALFMGLMKIAEEAGVIRFLSRIIGPFFSKLFP